MRAMLLAAMLALTAAAAAGAEPAVKDVTREYASDDLSSLFRPSEDFLGFIGPNYQRLQIFYSAIRRDPRRPMVYLIGGYDVVKNNR